MGRVTPVEVKSFFERNTCIRSYHNVYIKVWDATIGEALVCEGEPKSTSDPYAVAVKKEGISIGHLLKTVAHVINRSLTRVQKI